MAAKELKKIEEIRNFDQAIVDAMNAAHKAGLSIDDIKTTLERWVSLMEIE
jgi:calcineurin-like phosphoesterase